MIAENILDQFPRKYVTEPGIEPAISGSPVRRAADLASDFKFGAPYHFNNFPLSYDVALTLLQRCPHIMFTCLVLERERRERERITSFFACFLDFQARTIFPFSKLRGGRVVRWCWVNFQCRGVLQFSLL